MKMGYMRESAAGPTLAEQEALLRQAGVADFGRDAPVYIDKPRRGPVATTPERDKMVRYLRPGDVVVIAKASRLGTTRADRLQGNTKMAAAAAWADLTKTVRDVAVEFNVGARTLYRLFGPRGTPRFGKKAQP